MKALLIDNNSKHIDILSELLSEKFSDVRIVRFDEIELPRDLDADFILLSGGNGPAIPENHERLLKEVELILRARCPVLGICFGFELIADTFGTELLLRAENQKGIIEVEVTQDDPIFSGRKNFKASISHKYHAEKVPKRLVELARSADGIQVFRHVSLPIWGFQFHPEHFEPANDGAEIFRSLLKSLSQDSVSK